MPFVIFQRDHLRSTSGITRGSGSFAVQFGNHFRSGVICGRGSFAALYRPLNFHVFYSRVWHAISDVFHVVANAHTKSVQKQVKSIDVDKVRSKKTLSEWKLFRVELIALSFLDIISKQAKLDAAVSVYLFLFAHHQAIPWTVKRLSARSKHGQLAHLDDNAFCSTGLFTADQQLKGNSPIYTRQNNAGNRRGYEIPEERDYYPYWGPSPWRDIAIMVSDVKTFDLMKRHVNSSQYGYKCECILVKILFRNIKGGFIRSWNYSRWISLYSGEKSLEKSCPLLDGEGSENVNNNQSRVGSFPIAEYSLSRCICRFEFFIFYA